MTKIDRKRAFDVPQSVFKYLGPVVHRRELSYDDKVTVLRNLKQELMQLHKAAEESRLGERGTRDVGSPRPALSP